MISFHFNDFILVLFPALSCSVKHIEMCQWSSEQPLLLFMFVVTLNSKEPKCLSVAGRGML